MHDHHPHSTRSRRRAGVSLIELTVVMILVAIGAAVIAPRWTQALDRTRVTSVGHLLKSDFAALRRWSVRRGKLVTITFAGSSMTLNPPVPELLGDASGAVVLADRYPGVNFIAANFDGYNPFAINIYGELIAPSTGNRLNNAWVKITGSSSSQIVDFLTQEGLASAAAPSNP